MQVDLRALAAAADIDAAVDHYSQEAGSRTAVDFIDALEVAINRLRHYPNSGSLRFAFELEIPELRSWSLQKFPYLIFYVPQDDRIDIWRVLHARRDIPAHLTAEPPGQTSSAEKHQSLVRSEHAQQPPADEPVVAGCPAPLRDGALGCELLAGR